jgi:hypothetical protein
MSWSPVSVLSITKVKHAKRKKVRDEELNDKKIQMTNNQIQYEEPVWSLDSKNFKNHV